MTQRPASVRSRRAKTSSAKASPSRADEKRREIILAAATEFSRKGYGETTLGDIAHRLGIHTAGLYYYFENKDDIVSALLEYGAYRILSQCQDALGELGEASPVERIKVMIRAHIKAIGHRDDVGRAFHKIYDQVSPDLRKRGLATNQELFDLWRSLVNAAVESGAIRSDLSPALFRLLLVGSIIWLQEWYRSGGEITLDDIADGVIAIYIEAPNVAKTPASKPSRRKPKR